MTLDYLLQIVFVAFSAITGFTVDEEEINVAHIFVLIVVAYASYLFFLLPGLYLGVTNVFGLHIFPKVSIFLIQHFFPNVMWILYTFGIVGYSLALLTEEK